MIDVNQNYSREVECEYKGEKYKVRDNGAILRMAREGKPKRPKDEVWTFGESINRGYAWFCGEAVHRIVAYAFLGQPPTPQHVVDHIDTNRQNNRPENLRWLTKLENILLNPITKAKIEFWCGSVENFLKDPSQLSGHEKEDANFTWMRAVNPVEAQRTLASWERLLSKSGPRIMSKGNPIEEWIFKQSRFDKDLDFINDIEPVNTTITPTSTLNVEPDNSTMQANSVRNESNRRYISKTEFMKAIQETCKSEGWKCKKNYKAEDWKADVLITIDNQSIAISIYKRAKEAGKFLPLMERDGVKGYGLILSSWDDEISHFPCFNLQWNENGMEVIVSESKLSLAEFIKKVSENKIEHLSKTKITAVDVIFDEMECYSCKSTHYIFYVRYLVDEKGKRYDDAYGGYEHDQPNLPDLQFGEEILEVVRRYIDEHPEKGIIMGEVKERHSRTRNEDYVSFGCPKCDAIVGDFYLRNMEIDLMYENDESRMNRIQLKTPFEMPISDWVVNE